MENRYRKNIGKEEMDVLPPFVFTGNTVVIEAGEDARRTALELAGKPWLGFDTETRPSFRKGEVHKVGLLQLSTEECVYLFRLNRCGFVPELAGLMADPGVLKIGVGIRDDIRNLRKLSEFSPASFLDLQVYAEEFGIEDKSFSKLMAIIFGVKISKKQRISNWEAPVLTEAQIRYAATDAWGALRMYRRLSGQD